METYRKFYRILVNSQALMLLPFFCGKGSLKGRAQASTRLRALEPGTMALTPAVALTWGSRFQSSRVCSELKDLRT